MKHIVILAYIIMASLACAGSNDALSRSIETNVSIITISGEIKNLKLDQKVTIPWRKGITLEQVIRDAGGLSEYAYQIELIDATGYERKFSVYVLYKKDKTVQEMLIDPNTTIRVIRGRWL